MGGELLGTICAYLRIALRNADISIAHQLQSSICGELQDGICPEARAWLGGVEIVRYGVVGGIEGDGVALSVEQFRYSGEESVRLAIALATIFQIQLGSTQQAELTVDFRHCDSIGMVDGDGFLFRER